MGHLEENHRRPRDEALDVSEDDLEGRLVAAKLFQRSSGGAFRALQAARGENGDVSRKMTVGGIDLVAKRLHELSQPILDVGHNRILRRFHECVSTCR